MKSWLKTTTILLAAAALSACGSNKRPEYQGADYYKSLELPPDLTLQKSSAEMEIPEPTVSALDDFQSRHKLNKAVAPEFKGIRLNHEGSMYFLEVDAEPEVVWPKLEAFWEHEGVRLVQNQPMLGFMQTDWTAQMQVRKDAGYLTKLFSKIEPDFRDKFRMRVEPAADRTKTHIFVAHYGIEVVVEGSGDDQGATYWRGRESDIELEREVLSRLTLFAGLSENQAESLLLEYKPLQSYVTYQETFRGDDVDPPAEGGFGSSKVAVLSMKGSMDFVWYRTIRALDRMQMENISLDKKKGRISFTVPALDGKSADEESGSNWFADLFKSETRDKQRRKAESFVLVLAEQPGYVDFTLLDTRGVEATSATASQVRQALALALE